MGTQKVCCGSARSARKTSHRMSGKAGGFRGKSDKGSKGSKSARPHAGNRGGKLHRHGRGERPNALNVFQTGDDVQELSDDGITNLGSSKAKFQDEDIDEDDAFDEEDYKKYGALMSKGKSKGKKPAQGKAAKRSQQEIDDENEDLDGEELPGGMSLSDMLDGDDGISEDDEVPAKRSKYDESDDDEAADNLISSIGKATASSTAAVKRKRLQAAEQTELVPEAEFNLRSNPSGGASSLSLADLLGAATANTNGNSDGAKAVKRLKGMKQDARGSGPTAKLSAPLAEHQQEHADRLVAYEKSQEDVTKWQPIVRRNRQAEQLSFPLAAGADGVGAGNQGVATASTTNALATKFEASTSLERDLDSIMKQYGMDEQDIVRAQQLEMRKLDPEEVKRREAELARMRSVLFYHELKLKRVAKIKSKTFRKIRKRQAERNGEEGSDDEVEGSKAEQLKAEIERAKERMTLKHNNTSKWAKHVLSRGAHKDEDQKKALAEQLRKGQQLRRKMNRLDDDDDDDVDDIDSDELDDSDDLDASGSESDGSDANIDNDQQLIRDPSELAEKEAEPTTGLFALKFMKRGAEKRQKAASALLAELDAQEKEEREFAKDNGQGAISKKFAGKQSAVARADDAATKWLNDTADADADDWGAENMDGDDEEQQAAMRDAAQKKELEEAKLKSADHRAREQASGRRTFNANGARSSDVVQGSVELLSNSLQTTSAGMSAGAKTRMSAPIEVDSSNMKHSLPNKKADDFISFDNTEVAFSSAHSEINKPIALSKAATKAKSQVVTSAPTEQNPWNSSGAGKNAQATTEVLDTSATLQLNAPSTLVDLDADVMGEEQTKLIRQAFTTANEDEEDEIVKEKMEQAEENVPEATPQLPGWGFWGGSGTKTPKFVEKQRLAEEAKREAAKQKHLASRSDAGLRGVIINEKRDKKSAKYMVKALPFPFTNAAHYEHAIRAPVGSDWNTQYTHHQLTKPAIKVKSGHLITPITMGAANAALNSQRVEEAKEAAKRQLQSGKKDAGKRKAIK